MGKYLKYSCGYWHDGKEELDESEEEMLKITCERAQIKDGQQILELGCGWGSLSMWMAKNTQNLILLLFLILFRKNFL